MLNKNKLKIFIEFLLIFLSIEITKSNEIEPQKGVVVCSFQSLAYYRNDFGRYTVYDIPFEKCTHVLYASIGLNDADWSVLYKNERYGIGLDGFIRFTNLTREYPHLKAIIALGGWYDDARKYSQMAASVDHRQTFINNLVSFMTEFNFDGLNVDWSHPGSQDLGGSPEDKENFVIFMNELKNAFLSASKDWELSLSAPIATGRLDLGYNLPELCKTVDRIHASTFDLRGSWQEFTDVPSPLYKRPQDVEDFEKLNINDGVNILFERGCPLNKIVVGVSFTGRSYKLRDDNLYRGIGAPIISEGPPGPWLNLPGVLGYNEICYELKNSAEKWKSRWDNFGESPFMFNENELIWIGYENPDSLKYKIDYIKYNGLAGVLIWSVDMDDFRGLCNSNKINIMTSTIWDKMKDYIVPS